VQLHVSDDGGKTFVQNGVLHSDHHAFWIDPANPNHLITGNDGGIGVSYDRGQNWEAIVNMDLGQFYHVGFDMERPYNVYGGLQDNYSWGGPSAVRGRLGIVNDDWTSIFGGDGFVAIVDPTDSRIVYAESQDGNIGRVDRVTNERKNIRPVAPRGEPAYRWNWNTPLVISRHDPATVFAGANRLFRSTDRGQSWGAISPDLTENADREAVSLMGVSMKDVRIAKHDGIAAYGTLVAFSESPRRAGLYYTGADDGTVQVSRDGGKTWTNVTARIGGLPKNTYVSRLVASAHDEGTVYAAFDGHRHDDYGTYAYASSDFGATWRSIAGDLPKGHTLQALTEDPKNADVLYAGSEFGLFVTLDRGVHWTRLRGGLPTVPIYGIAIHPRENDMILATHGRSIWILDDITPIQRAAEAMKKEAHLVEGRAATIFNPANNRGFIGNNRFFGRNPTFGAALTYYLRSAPKELRIRIADGSGAAVRELSGSALRESRSAGFNRVYWDLRHEPLPPLRGQQTGGGGGGGGFGGGGLNGPFVLPGGYRVALLVDGREAATGTVSVTGDPDIQITDSDRRTQHDMALALHRLQRTANEAADAVGALSERAQEIETLLERASTASEAVRTASGSLSKKLAGLRPRLGVPAPGQPAGGGGGGGGFGGQQNVRGQIGGAKNQIMASTSLPTAVQLRTARDAREDLAKLVEEINAVIATDMPALEKMLADQGIRGVQVKPIGAVGNLPPP
jgi:photosystem II stability/assembly factor-like uncharacterized protein